MFDGEYISLDVLNAMETVRVPKPIKVVYEIMYMSVLKQTLL
jgi:serine/threonine-protein kinase RIO1